MVDLEGEDHLAPLEVGMDAGDLADVDAGQADVGVGLDAAGAVEDGREPVGVIEDPKRADGEGGGDEHGGHHQRHDADHDLVEVSE